MEINRWKSLQSLKSLSVDISVEIDQLMKILAISVIFSDLFSPRAFLSNFVSTSDINIYIMYSKQLYNKTITHWNVYIQKCNCYITIHNIYNKYLYNKYYI